MNIKKNLQGWVRVRVKGTQMGRFLSVLLARGILYENAGYEGEVLYLELPAGQFREAAACGKKTGTRLRIVSKRGLPFLFFRHRRRKWTFLFVLPMILALFMLPRFIWNIEMEGVESISRVEMLRRLEELGISEGMWYQGINLDQAENELLLKYEDLSFASFIQEGTTLRVILEEAVAKPEMVDRSDFCNVVAKETCVIYSIVTEAGTPLVKSGDVVKTGDVMIKGEVVLQDDAGNQTAVPVRAAGVIYGKVVWREEAEIEKEYVRQIFSGEAKRGIRIRFLGWDVELRWPLGIGEKETVMEEEIWRLPLGGFLSFHKLTYEEYVKQEAEYAQEEMEIRLQEELERRAAQQLEMGERIVLEENWQIEETETGMKAVLELVMMENIGVSVPAGGEQVKE